MFLKSSKYFSISYQDKGEVIEYLEDCDIPSVEINWKSNLYKSSIITKNYHIKEMMIQTLNQCSSIVEDKTTKESRRCKNRFKCNSLFCCKHKEKTNLFNNI